MPDPAVIPHDEVRRIAALQRYAILDTPRDGAFDRITQIAARIFNVPIAIVSLVDHDRIWFKSHHGLDVAEIGREPGLCASAILGEAAWIVTEAHVDPRTLANPLVAGAFGLRFYAGVPLRTHDGYNLGTLCVIDQAPREITTEEIAQLEDLAGLVMEQMELRLAARRSAERVAIIQREVDHRLVNNLNTLSLMLMMQQDEVVDLLARHQLRDAASRISAIADLHRAFLTTGWGAADDPAPERAAGLTYLRRLCIKLSEMLGGRIEVAGTEIILHPLQVQSLGLIVHELAMNALKHGGRRIVIRLATTGDGRHKLTVSDDGPGLPDGFDPWDESHGGVGMSIVVAMTEQLEGELTFDSPTAGGVTFAVSFPATLAGR
ncbi:sensor histidine kinase [Sphingomonas crocodyli]|uniref:histidine kinase n=1 Tax=Sphingomonas crocodyli TaxID=1979270 RepID=A0A437M861_9SPHN|nr:ATP-binding protein [Sphingomonas crocodyli]RVT93918.1 GAF domain-containing protein [Sphingomonas crocodyli]